MPEPQMTDAQRQQQAAEKRAFKLLEEKLWNDSKIGPQVQQIVKEMYPDAKTNEDVFGPALSPLREQNEALAKQIKEMREEREAEKREAEQAMQQKSLQDRLDTARKSFQLTSEGFDMMVARMKETGNFSDAEAAAAWVASKAAPKAIKGPSFGPAKANFFGVGKKDDAWAELHDSPLDYQDNQLREFAADPDKYVAETFGAAA